MGVGALVLCRFAHLVVCLLLAVTGRVAKYVSWEEFYGRQSRRRCGWSRRRCGWSRRRCGCGPGADVAGSRRRSSPYGLSRRRCGPVPAPHAISSRQGRPGRASAVGLCASNAAGFEPPTATRTGGGATGCGAGTQSITPRWYGPKRERPKWERPGAGLARCP